MYQYSQYMSKVHFHHAVLGAFFVILISKNACKASHSFAGHLLVCNSHSLSAYLGSCTLFQSPSALSYWPSSHSAAARAALGSSKSGYLLNRLLQIAFRLCYRATSRSTAIFMLLLRPTLSACSRAFTFSGAQMTLTILRKAARQSNKINWHIQTAFTDCLKTDMVNVHGALVCDRPHLSHGLIGLAASIQRQRPVRAGKAEGWRQLYGLLVVLS